jgi:putative aldouronate transport system substrate-binding protein
LDDLLAQDAPNILEQVPESYWDATRIGGKIYGVINYQISARINGLAFPRPVVDDLGYDVSKIKKYSDLEEYLALAKEKRSDLTPFLGFGLTGEMPWLNNFDTGFEIDYLSGPLGVRQGDPQTAINVVETQEFKDFCAMTRSWYENGYVRADVASISDYKAEEDSFLYASWTSGISIKDADGNAAGSVAAGKPKVQAQTIPPLLSTGSIQAALTAISRTSKNPETAIKVLDFLFADKEAYNILVHGIKDKHYTEPNDWSISPIIDSGYMPEIAWVFGSWFNAKLIEGQPEDYWDYYRNVNETALASPVLGFVYDPSNVRNELAQITALIAEYLPGLSTGSVNPDEKIPELIEKMNQAGMGTVIEDASEQLKTWAASQA